MPRIRPVAFIFAGIILLFLICSCSQEETEDTGNFDYRTNIEKYQKLLQDKPTNCFYLEQIAGNYQGLNDFIQAISYYNKALKYCPENMHNKFQLGICHYLIMEKEQGIKLMDEAILDAERANDAEFLAIYKQEKAAWLEKWDSVKELEWNKNKQ